MRPIRTVPPSHGLTAQPAMTGFAPVLFKSVLAAILGAACTLVVMPRSTAPASSKTVPLRSAIVPYEGPPGSVAAQHMLVTCFSLIGLLSWRSPAPAAPSPTSASSADSLSTSAAKTNPFTAVSTANNPTLVATPAPVTIAEGSTEAAFSLPTGGSTLLAAASLKIHATDGTVSPYARLTLVPVVQLTAVTANPVEGGFTTYGTISLNIPAQAGGAVATLASGDTTLLAVRATVTIPYGYKAFSFAMNTRPVSVATTVPVTATFDGGSVSTSVSLRPAPIIALVSIVMPFVVGGQQTVGTVTLNNFVRSASGAVVTLASGDTGTLHVPATVTIPQGASSASFTATTAVVPGLKGVSVKATYNCCNLTCWAG